MTTPKTYRLAALSLTTVLSACAGSIEENPDPGATSGSAPTPSRPVKSQEAGLLGTTSGDPLSGVGARPIPGGSAPPAPGVLSVPGPALPDPSCQTKGTSVAPRARRISPDEYTKTVKALLYGRGADGPLPVGFKAPLGALSDPNDRYARFAGTSSIGDAEVTDLLDVGMVVGTAVANKLEATPGNCLKSGAPFGDCARKTIQSAGEIIFRRPLDPDQEKAFVSLAEGALTERGAKGSLALCIQAMLASPGMIFHLELGRTPGTAGTPARLDSFEMANAISSLFTAGPPDDFLWQAAKAGQLTTADQIRPHVIRLLGDFTKAPPVLMQFVRELFGYERVVDVFKDEKTHSPTGLIRDTDALVAELLAKNGHTGFFEALLTTPTAFASAATSTSYGLSAQALTHKEPRVILGMGPRAGLLTQPSFLARNSDNKHTAPVKRGKFVRQELLCQTVPAVPVGLVPVLPDRPMTAREKLAIHVEKPECRACHQLMDPFGLAFEIYDHLGKHRTTDVGKTIDATGLLEGSGDQDGSFKDVVELTGRLGRSTATAACLSRQLFRFISARNDQPSDACAVAKVADAYIRSKGDLTEAIVASLAAETFGARSAAQ